MSAKEKDLEIEDDLARGGYTIITPKGIGSDSQVGSSKDSARLQGQDFKPIQEEFRFGEGCPIPGFKNCPSHPKPNGIGRGL